MERARLAGMITFFHDGPIIAGTVELSDEAAHHAHVRRVTTADPIRLTDGRGRVGRGEVRSVSKAAVTVDIMELSRVPEPAAIHLFVPVADRDRLLWAAEKTVELGIASWTPVFFHRSRSVSPRGEGDAFRRKTRLRMIGALEQSGGAWLPALREQIGISELPAIHDRSGYVLDRAGAPLTGMSGGEASVLVGPEGGIEEGEMELIRARGWRPASLGGTTLRFETAAVAAVAVMRVGLNLGGT